MRTARLASLAAAAAVLAAGCDSARRIEQRSEVNACARCHGFPPAEPHPQAVNCEVCHRATVGDGTQLLANGAHMNGRIDLQAHPKPYPLHSVEVYGGLEGCTFCHGSDFNGGAAPSCNACHATIGFADWTTNCTFCHGTRTSGWTPAQAALPAPPEAVLRSNDFPEYSGVGAHRGHVQADTFANPIACTECHPQVSNLAHVNRSTEMSWGPVATADSAVPEWTGTTCANYCHGATLPRPGSATEAAKALRSAPTTWAPASTVVCGSCHEADPTTGIHPAVSTGHRTFACLVCHGGTHTATAADRAIHVNGTIETNDIAGFDPVARSCAAACHAGNRNWPAPAP
jgi:hypothetical protein